MHDWQPEYDSTGDWTFRSGIYQNVLKQSFRQNKIALIDHNNVYIKSLDSTNWQNISQDEAEIRIAAFSANSKEIAICNTFTISFFSLEKAKATLKTSVQYARPIVGIQYHPMRDELVLIHSESSVHLYPTDIHVQFGEKIQYCIWSNDGKMLVVAGGHGIRYLTFCDQFASIETESCLLLPGGDICAIESSDRNRFIVTTEAKAAASISKSTANIVIEKKVSSMLEQLTADCQQQVQESEGVLAQVHFVSQYEIFQSINITGIFSPNIIACKQSTVVISGASTNRIHFYQIKNTLLQHMSDELLYEKAVIKGLTFVSKSKLIALVGKRIKETVGFFSLSNKKFQTSIMSTELIQLVSEVIEPLEPQLQTLYAALKSHIDARFDLLENKMMDILLRHENST